MKETEELKCIIKGKCSLPFSSIFFSLLNGKHPGTEGLFWEVLFNGNLTFVQAHPDAFGSNTHFW